MRWLVVAATTQLRFSLPSKRRFTGCLGSQRSMGGNRLRVCLPQSRAIMDLQRCLPVLVGLLEYGLTPATAYPTLHEILRSSPPTAATMQPRGLQSYFFSLPS